MTHLLLAIALALLAATDAARPVKLEPAAARAVVQEIEAARARSQEALRTSPTSYLATVNRKDFESKTTLTVGRAADNDIQLDDPSVERHHLRVSVEGDDFRLAALDERARITIDGAERREAVVPPSAIGVGRFVLRLSHQRFPAIIVFDPKSPRFGEYKGLQYFPVDLSYRFELPLTPNPRPERIVILSTRGNRRQAERVGWFDVLIDGTPCRLEATRLLEPGVGEDDVAVYFRDATSGKESYALGRYVDAKRLPDGRYLLDFNLAYNPACAYSVHYNCPIPPKGNTLTVAVRAGEQDSHYH